MTREDESKERQIYHAEMLGILCGTAEPGERQLQLARCWTDRHIKKCRERERNERKPQ